MTDYIRKWRTIVDGDTWFFAKNVLGGAYESPKFGIHKSENEKTIYYCCKDTHFRFRLTNDEFEEFSSHLKECVEKSLTCEQEHYLQEGKYIIRELKTRYEAVIHIHSMWDGKIKIKFVLYDTKGEDYVVCGMSCGVTINGNEVEELLD